MKSFWLRQQRESLVLLRWLMMRRGAGGTAGADCRLGCHALGLDNWIVLKLSQLLSVGLRPVPKDGLSVAVYMYQ